MRKFKSGEKARYVGSKYTTDPYYRRYLGQEVIIQGTYESCGTLPNAYTVLTSNGEMFGVAEISLRKILPQSDSYEKGSWDEFNRIIKQPTGVTTP